MEKEFIVTLEEEMPLDCSFDFLKGDDGMGIATITSGTPIQNDSYTLTPITFNKTDGSSTTVNVSAKNGNQVTKTSELQNDSDFTTNEHVDSLIGDINTILATLTTVNEVDNNGNNE